MGGEWPGAEEKKELTLSAQREREAESTKNLEEGRC
jgi:hypothetical protein